MNMIPTEIDGEPIWLEAEIEPGDQPTAFGRRRGADLPEVLSRAQKAIAYLSRETLEAARSVANDVACPEQVEIQFGLKFSTQGSIILAGSSLESSLSVKVVYARSEILRERGDDGDGARSEEVVLDGDQ